MRTNRLARVKTWALYYGNNRSVPLHRYDLAVVAPEAWDSRSVRALQAGGTLVLGYISGLEVPKKEGSPPPVNVLSVHGRAAEQSEWGSWILDPRSPATVRRLVQQAGALTNSGYDGFFLDTLGDMESPNLPAALRATLVPAAALLISELRARFPERVVVQSGGLGGLLDLTLPYLDGVCWEDFPTGLVQPWHRVLANRLQTANKSGVKIFTLSHRESLEAHTWAHELKFCWYGAPGSYAELAGGEVG